MRAEILRLNIIRPVLMDLGLWSQSAENLLLGTAAQESHLTYIHQVDGPALGIWQMEPATHDDIHLNYLQYNDSIRNKVLGYVFPKMSGVEQLSGNLYYGCAITRIHYLRVKEGLPAHDDIEALGRYWKQYYNTKWGKGSVDEFVKNYLKFIGDV